MVNYYIKFKDSTFSDTPCFVSADRFWIYSIDNHECFMFVHDNRVIFSIDSRLISSICHKDYFPVDDHVEIKNSFIYDYEV